MITHFFTLKQKEQEPHFRGGSGSGQIGRLRNTLSHSVLSITVSALIGGPLYCPFSTIALF